MPWVYDPVFGRNIWVGDGDIPVGSDPPPTPDAPHDEYVYGPDGTVVGIIRSGKHEVPLPTPGFPPSPGDVSRGQPFRLSRLAGAVLPEGGIIPIVYGQMRVEAQQFAYKPYLPTGSPVYGGYAICAGPIDSIVATRVNGYPYTGSSPVAVTTYLGTSAGNSNFNLPSEPDGYLLLHPYLAWAFVELWSTGEGWDLKSLAFDVKGRKVLDFRTETTAWSDNPILCLYDLLTDKDFGAGLPASLFDSSAGGTWRTAADACDAVVDGAARYKLNIALGRGMTVQGAIDAIRAVCAADLYFHRGLLRVYVDGLRPTAALTLTEGDNCRNVVLTQTPPADLPNAVVIDFPDAAKEYVSSTVTVETDALVAGTEPRREARYQLEGSTSETQSTRIGRLYLRRTNFAPRRIALIAGPDAEELLIGDRIDVNISSCGLAAQPFVVEGLQRLDAGEWAIDGREYDAAVYSDEAIATDTPPNLSEPSPFDDPPLPCFVAEASFGRLYFGTAYEADVDEQFGIGRWSASGFGYVTGGVGASLNDGNYASTDPVGGGWNTSGATPGRIILDAGSGEARRFRGVSLWRTGVHSTVPIVRYSDDGSSWTTVSAQRVRYAPGGGDWPGDFPEHLYVFAWDDVGTHRYWALEASSTPAAQENFVEIQFHVAKFDPWPYIERYEVRLHAFPQTLIASVPAGSRPTAAAPLDVTAAIDEEAQAGWPTRTYDIDVTVISTLGKVSLGQRFVGIGAHDATSSPYVIRQTGSTPTVQQAGSDAMDGTRKGAVLEATARLLLDSNPSAAVSGAGQIALRDNAGALEASVNGGAYAALGGGSLTVKESDGSPSVANVTEIRVDGATVTDEGGGAVTIGITGGAGSLQFTPQHDYFEGDGSETDFALTNPAGGSTAAYLLLVTVNGADDTANWSFSGAGTLVRSSAVPDGDQVHAVTLAALGTTAGVQIDTDTGDGSSTDFPVTGTPLALLYAVRQNAFADGCVLVNVAGTIYCRYPSAPPDGDALAFATLQS